MKLRISLSKLSTQQ